MVEFQEPKLWDHQKEAVALASNQDCFAFLFDAGTGKTAACIKTLRCKYERSDTLLSTLVIAPIIVLENWKNEFDKFSRIPLDKIVILEGTNDKRIKTLKRAREKFKDNFIAIVNYEIISTSQALVDEILAWSPVCLVIDESQKIKALDSKRTKKVIQIADKAKHRYLLSGTPILNSPLDIFAQWRALDGGETFGRNFFMFRAKYFYDKNANMPKHSYFPNWTILPNSYEEIKKLISSKSLRARKEDCLDLPPLIRVNYPIKLSSEQRRHYESMRDNFVTYLESSTVVADIVLTKMIRLLQICTGFMKDDEGKIFRFQTTPRQEALKEILEQIVSDHKVLIWCVFKENYNQVADVCKQLGVTYVEAHGDISAEDKYKNVDLFNNDDRVRCFIGHPASLGIGINLCAASYSIVYSRSWSLENDLQSEARNYRAGSERHDSITKINLYSEDTIDHGILQCLEQKLTDANKIIGFMKKFIKEKKK